LKETVMARCRSGSSSWLWGEGLALTDSDITSLSVLATLKGASHINRRNDIPNSEKK